MATRTLTLEDLVAAARQLSPRDQLRLIERLAAEVGPRLPAEPPDIQPEPPETSSAPRPSLRGLWADLGVDLSEDEIRQLRREAWAGLGDRDV